LLCRNFGELSLATLGRFCAQGSRIGYHKVSHIYKHGPADKDYVKINVGDSAASLAGNLSEAAPSLVNDLLRPANSASLAAQSALLNPCAAVERHQEEWKTSRVFSVAEPLASPTDKTSRLAQRFPVSP
jgi:hypothetical protein